MTRGILSAMPGSPGEPTAYHRGPTGGLTGYPRADHGGDHYRTATSPNAEFPMVTAARVPADGTWSNLLRQWATSATTENGKGGKRSAKVTPNCSWQPPVSSDSSRFQLDDARGPPSSPPWSGRGVTGHEFGHPSRNCGVTSVPVVASFQTTAASRGIAAPPWNGRGVTESGEIGLKRANPAMTLPDALQPLAREPSRIPPRIGRGVTKSGEFGPKTANRSQKGPDIVAVAAGMPTSRPP